MGDSEMEKKNCLTLPLKTKFQNISDGGGFLKKIYTVKLINRGKPLGKFENKWRQ